jgi:hypothetical protein
MRKAILLAVQNDIYSEKLNLAYLCFISILRDTNDPL